jgi:ribosomal protein S14
MSRILVSWQGHLCNWTSHKMYFTMFYHLLNDSEQILTDRKTCECGHNLALTRQREFCRQEFRWMSLASSHLRGVDSSSFKENWTRSSWLSLPSLAGTLDCSSSNMWRALDSLARSYSGLSLPSSCDSLVHRDLVFMRWPIFPLFV